MNRLAGLLAAAFAFFGMAPAAASEAVDLLVRHAAIVDVASGTVTADRAIAVRGDRILAVGADAAIAARYSAARIVDASGAFAMPGLWDMHVHFGGGDTLVAENRALIPIYLAYGITTVRDCAGDLPQEVLRWRDETAAGTLLGPRIFTSGPKLEGLHPIWHGTIEVDSPAAVDAALDRLQAMRVDFIKITDNTLRPEIFLYAAQAAHRRGLRVSAHTPYALTIEAAARAGLSAVEHLDYMIKAGSPREAEIAADYAAGRLTYAQAGARLRESFDPAYAAASYRRLAALGIAVTPTLNMTRIIAWLNEEDHSHDEGLALIGPGLRATYDWRVGRAAHWTPEEVASRRRDYQLSLRILPMLRDAGIPILAGTDAGYLNSFNYPGQGLHDELARYVEAGLTPAQALRTATITGPDFMGVAAHYGALAAGRTADIVLLDANPLADIAATRRIRTVVTRGRVLDRAALDSILAEARAVASR
ncbi:MAG TPA: amidohydrolase family protein [Allosphingosinicella sp.]|nr:amidohydrolase family protein [Allosphingosinicella sp.]